MPTDPPTTVTVYGASDDLIEVEGTIDEEFSVGADGNLLAFSDGTVLRIQHTDVWRITPVVVPDQGLLSIVQCPENDEDNYSDRATLTGNILWVVLGSEIAQP